MEKLQDKIEHTLNTWIEADAGDDGIEIIGIAGSSEKISEECKSIAIAFAKYTSERHFNQISDSMREELFTEFLKEYYK